MNFRRRKPKEQGIRNGDWHYSGVIRRMFRQSKGTVVLPEAGIRKPRVDEPLYDDDCPLCSNWNSMYEEEDL